MAALNINTHHGPKTFKADAPVKAGQFVVPGGKGGVKPAGADADNVLGVAILDAAPETPPVDGVLVTKPKNTSVAYGPVEVYLETTSKLAQGTKVGVAADGKAKAHSAGDVVGIVVDPAPTDTRALVRLK